MGWRRARGRRRAGSGRSWRCRRTRTRRALVSVRSPRSASACGAPGGGRLRRRSPSERRRLDQAGVLEDLEVVGEQVRRHPQHAPASSAGGGVAERRAGPRSAGGRVAERRVDARPLLDCETCSMFIDSSLTECILRRQDDAWSMTRLLGGACWPSSSAPACWSRSWSGRASPPSSSRRTTSGCSCWRTPPRPFLGLTVLILLFGPVSGAHFNPVVSLADWFLGRRNRARPAHRRGRRVHGRPGRRRRSAARSWPTSCSSVAPAVSTKRPRDRQAICWPRSSPPGLLALIFALVRTGRGAARRAGGRRLHRRRLNVVVPHRDGARSDVSRARGAARGARCRARRRRASRSAAGPRGCGSRRSGAARWRRGSRGRSRSAASTGRRRRPR